MAEKLSNRYSYQTFFCYERRRLRSVNTKFALQNPANGAAPAVGLGQTVLFISAKSQLTPPNLFNVWVKWPVGIIHFHNFLFYSHWSAWHKLKEYHRCLYLWSYDTISKQRASWFVQILYPSPACKDTPHCWNWLHPIQPYTFPPVVFRKPA